MGLTITRFSGSSGSPTDSDKPSHEILQNEQPVLILFLVTKLLRSVEAQRYPHFGDIMVVAERKKLECARHSRQKENGHSLVRQKL